MYEKVNPQHPDKTADRIAGALVDLAYTKEKNPRVAFEVLLGHGICHIMAETSVHFTNSEVARIVRRIAPELTVDYLEVKQDGILAKNQLDKIRCGDNGIFRGVPVTEEQKRLTEMAKLLYLAYGKDGKYILDGDRNCCILLTAKTASTFLTVTALSYVRAMQIQKNSVRCSRMLKSILLVTGQAAVMLTAVQQIANLAATWVTALQAVGCTESPFVKPMSA